MFKNLTNDELVELFNTIKNGRDRAWRSPTPDGLSFYPLVIDASDILTDIHNENQTR